MSTHRSLIDAALERARAQVASGDLGDNEKIASADSDLVSEARDVADALEFIAIKTADDGTPEGSHRLSMIEQFLADKTAAEHAPPTSDAPTGTQPVPPQSGSRTITSSSSTASGPTQHEAPTGTQATLDQPPPAVKTSPTEPASSKKASLYDLVLGNKTAAKGGPADCVALDGSGAPPSKNENTNIGLLRSNEAPVSATKRSARSPTRARLKQLFASASDTGPAQAAAKAAWPKAYAGSGGIKEAFFPAKALGKTFKGVDPLKKVGPRQAAAAVGKRIGNLTGREAAGLVGGAAATTAATTGVGHKVIKSKIEKRKAQQIPKVGSVREWSEAFDAFSAGKAGPEAAQFAQYVSEIPVQ